MYQSILISYSSYVIGFQHHIKMLKIQGIMITTLYTIIK